MGRCNGWGAVDDTKREGDCISEIAAVIRIKLYYATPRWCDRGKSQKGQPVSLIVGH